MLGTLKKLFRAQTNVVSNMELLDSLRRQVERKNVAKVEDEFDMGYDMAIDEVIDLIDEYRRSLSTSGRAT